MAPDKSFFALFCIARERQRWIKEEWDPRQGRGFASPSSIPLMVRTYLRCLLLCLPVLVTYFPLVSCPRVTIKKREGECSQWHRNKTPTKCVLVNFSMYKHTSQGCVETFVNFTKPRILPFCTGLPL